MAYDASSFNERLDLPGFPPDHSSILEDDFYDPHHWSREWVAEGQVKVRWETLIGLAHDRDIEELRAAIRDRLRGFGGDDVRDEPLPGAAARRPTDEPGPATDEGSSGSPTTGPPAEAAKPIDWDDKPEGAQAPQDPQNPARNPPPALAGLTRQELALRLAGTGRRILPLKAGAKTPLIKGWPKEATTDEATIRGWFETWPNMNYGVAGGDGLLIVDLDVRDGKDGREALKALEAMHGHGAVPDTFTVRTPGTGDHLYFHGPKVLTSAGRVGLGIDVRSVGGYVVGPGSVVDGRAYTIVADVPAATAPEWLVLRCGIPEDKTHDRTPVADQDTPENIRQATKYLTSEAPPAVLRSGNETVYKVACQLRDLGVTEEKAIELMVDHYNPRCQPPWTDGLDTFVTPIRSAFAYGQNPPGAKSPTALATQGGNPADALVLSSPLAPAEHQAEPIEAAIRAVCDKATLTALLRMSPLLGDPIFAGQPRPPAPWLVKRVIPQTGIGIIYGPSTGGKSYLVLDLAAKLWRGEPWFGAKISERKATVILAFEGADFAGYRLDAIQRASNGEEPAVVVIRAGRMTPSGLRSLEPQLRGLERYFREVYDIPIGLVVFDTASSSGLVENEDKSGDVANALTAGQEAARVVGAFGLFVHHPNKSVGDMRGSGAWFNNVDTVLRLDAEKDAAIRTLRVEKVKDGQARELGLFVLEAITLGVDEDGEPITACVVAQADKHIQRSVDGPKHLDKFIQGFEEAARDRGTTWQGQPMAPISQVQALFREVAQPEFKSDDGVRQAWRRCLDYALKLEIIKSVRGERNTFVLTPAAYAIEDPNALPPVI